MKRRMNSESESLDPEAEFEVARKLAAPVTLKRGKTFWYRLERFAFPSGGYSAEWDDLVVTKLTSNRLELEIWTNMFSFVHAVSVTALITSPIFLLLLWFLFGIEDVVFKQWYPLSRDLIANVVHGTTETARELPRVLSSWGYWTFIVLVMAAPYFVLVLLVERLSHKPIILIFDADTRTLSCNSTDRFTNLFRGYLKPQHRSLDDLERVEFHEGGKEGITFMFTGGGGAPRVWRVRYTLHETERAIPHRLIAAFLLLHCPEVVVVPSVHEVRRREAEESAYQKKIASEKEVLRQLRTSKPPPSPEVCFLAREAHRSCLRACSWRVTIFLATVGPGMILIGVILILSWMIMVTWREMPTFTPGPLFFPIELINLGLVAMTFYVVSFFCSWIGHRLLPWDPYFPTPARLTFFYRFIIGFPTDAIDVSRSIAQDLLTVLGDSEHDSSSHDDDVLDWDDRDDDWAEVAEIITPVRHYLQARFSSEDGGATFFRFTLSFLFLLGGVIVPFVGELLMILSWYQRVHEMAGVAMGYLDPEAVSSLLLFVIFLVPFIFVAIQEVRTLLYLASFAFRLFSADDEALGPRLIVSGIPAVSFSLALLVGAFLWFSLSGFVALGLRVDFFGVIINMVTGAIIMLVAIPSGIGMYLIFHPVLQFLTRNNLFVDPSNEKIRALSLTRALRERVAAALAQRESSDARGATEATSPEGGGDDERTSLKILLDTLTEVERWATMDDAEFLAALWEVEAQRKTAIDETLLQSMGQNEKP